VSGIRDRISGISPFTHRFAMPVLTLLIPDA
jgi:hypothetical protein